MARALTSESAGEIRRLFNQRPAPRARRRPKAPPSSRTAAFLPRPSGSLTVTRLGLAAALSESPRASLYSLLSILEDTSALPYHRLLIRQGSDQC